VHCTTGCISQSSAPEDGRNYRPKHVEPIEIINKSLLLHIVVCLFYCISDARSHKHEREKEVWNIPAPCHHSADHQEHTDNITNSLNTWHTVCYGMTLTLINEYSCGHDEGGMGRLNS